MERKTFSYYGVLYMRKNYETRDKPYDALEGAIK